MAVAFSVKDKVVCKPQWTFGVAWGYDKNPGEVISCSAQDDVLEVRWHDGHISLQSSDELLPARSS